LITLNDRISEQHHAITKQHNFAAAADNQDLLLVTSKFMEVVQDLCRAAAVAAAAEPGFLPLISSVVGVVAVKPRASSKAACAVFDCNKMAATATGALSLCSLHVALLSCDVTYCNCCIPVSMLNPLPWVNMLCCFGLYL
jgi:hypothetical protein